jgi:hypothetical protein
MGSMIPAVTLIFLTLWFCCPRALAGVEGEVGAGAPSSGVSTQASNVAPVAGGGDKQGSKIERSDVMVVLVFDDSCQKWCDMVKPMIRELGIQYKVRVVEIDASRKVLAEAKETAKKLKIPNFLADAMDYIPLVGVFRNSKLCGSEIVGAKSKDVYSTAIQKAVAKK